MKKLASGHSDRALIYANDTDRPRGPIMRGIEKVAEEKGYRKLFFNKMSSAEGVKTAIYFSNNPHSFPFSIPNVKVGWWMCDLRPPNSVTPNDYFDAVFLCNKTYLKGYEDRFNCPAFYMPQCGSLEPIGKSEVVDWDVIFIGNFDSKYHLNRADILNKIKEKNKVKIISGNTNNTHNMGFLYKNSSFCLAISPQYDGYTSNRLYNILSYGGFCLTLYFPGIEDLFENHKHLVWFKEPEEANEIIDYYYSHPRKYAKIKKQGREHYLKNHTPEHRIEAMFRILESL